MNSAGQRSAAAVDVADEPGRDAQMCARCGSLLVARLEAFGAWPVGGRVAVTAAFAYPVSAGRELAECEHECVG